MKRSGFSGIFALTRRFIYACVHRFKRGGGYVCNPAARMRAFVRHICRCRGYMCCLFIKFLRGRRRFRTFVLRPARDIPVALLALCHKSGQLAHALLHDRLHRIPRPTRICMTVTRASTSPIAAEAQRPVERQHNPRRGVRLGRKSGRRDADRHIHTVGMCPRCATRR